MVSFGLLVFSVVVLFHWADGTRVLFVPLTGIPAILPALFTISGQVAAKVAVTVVAACTIVGSIVVWGVMTLLGVW